MFLAQVDDTKYYVGFEYLDNKGKHNVPAKLRKTKVYLTAIKDDQKALFTSEAVVNKKAGDTFNKVEGRKKAFTKVVSPFPREIRAELWKNLLRLIKY
jgi:hypothetical protein